MVGSMFAAVSGLKAHQTRLDVLGNNIANVNTWGYKAQTTHLVDAAYRTKTAGGANGWARDSKGGNNTSQIGYGANVGYISVNYTTGNWNPTGLGSDCMINGPGFLMVTNIPPAAGAATTTINGDDFDSTGVVAADTQADMAVDPSAGILLSRVGILGIDEEGYLVDSNGYYVLNYEQKAIQVPKDTTTTNPDGSNPYYTYGAITIQKDGTITGVVQTPAKHSGREMVLGQLGVASVQNINGLEHGEGYYFNIGPNAGDVLCNQTNAATGDIYGGYLEMSNTDLSTEITTMITTQRGYQANTKIITVTDEMLQELVNMKR